MRKTFLSSLIVGLLLSAGHLSAGHVAAAETPALIVSIAGVDNVMKDVSGLANIAGMGVEAAPLAIVGAQAQAFGLETKKPIGAVLYLGAAAPHGLAFVPVANFQQLVNMAKGLNFPFKDNGDGTYSVTGPAGNTVIIKEQNGWMFVAMSADDLANLPADPTTLLGGLDKQYTVAIRGNLQGVPAPLREQAIGLITAGAQAGLRQRPGEDEVQYMVRQKFVNGMIQRLGVMVKETDQLTFGWGVNAAAKKTAVDFNLTATAGSNLAKQYAEAKGLHSDFTGFLNPAAAADAHVSSKLQPEEVQQFVQMVGKFRENAMKSIDNDPNLATDEAKQAIKDVVNQLFDVAKATIESGRLNAGMVLNLSAKNLTFAAGGYVADGAGVEKALKKFVEVAKKAPDFPGVNFDVDKHQGVRFHTMSLPNPDPQAKQVFGDKIDVAIGIGEKSVYLAVGKDTIPTLKNIIDKSVSGATDTVLPGEVALSLGQVVDFIGQFENNPMVAALSAEIAKANGQDHIRLVTKPIENGANLHLEIEEGVIRSIGAAAKMGLAPGGRGAFGPGGPGGPARPGSSF